MVETNTVTPDAVISLREITEETVVTICKLSDTLSDVQKKMVAPNAVSIAQAHFSAYAWFRAIYAGETPVGFAMLYIGPDDSEGPTGDVFFLWRLMIAGPYQGKGFGEKAMQIIIDEVKSRGAAELLVSCGQGEGSPEGFYHKLGFERNGKMEDDEVVLALKL